MHVLTHLLIFLVSSYGLASIEKKETENSMIYDVKVEEFKKTEVEIEGKKFVQTSLVGISPYEGVIQEEGRPEIPVVRIYVEGDGEIKVSPEARRSVVADSYLPLYRAFPKVPKRRGFFRALSELKAPLEAESIRFLKDYEILTVGVKRGVLRRLVELYPIQWDPQSGDEKRIASFRVEVPKPPQTEKKNPAIGLIVPKRFAEGETLESWISFEKKLGYTVYVHTTEKESVDQIRTKIKQWYQENPDLDRLILLGDVEDVPSHYSETIKGYTDHYYASLDDDYTKDLATPELLVGRLPLKKLEDMDELWRRFDSYGQLPLKTNDWLRQSSLIATNDKDFWKITEESLLELVAKHFGPMGFIGSFPFNPMKGGDHLFAMTHKANGKDLKASFREGRGLIIYSGHGEPTGWEEPELLGQEVDSLELHGAMPFVFGFSCQTGRFTETSIAEAWVQKPHGAISSVGSYSDTYWDEDLILQRVTIDGLLLSNASVGDSIERGLEELWRYYGGKNLSSYYFETYHVFADPSVKYRVK